MQVDVIGLEKNVKTFLDSLWPLYKYEMLKTDDLSYGVFHHSLDLKDAEPYVNEVLRSKMDVSKIYIY